MDWLTILAGPAIGAVIGYFTNYLAVKMLFRPHNAIKIGGHTLPFTPGIIPRRKNELGAAIGKAVSAELFGAKQIGEILAGDAMKETVKNGILEAADSFMQKDTTVEQIAVDFMSEEMYQEQKEHLEAVLCDKVVEGALSMDIGTLIVEKGTEVISSQITNPLVAMFLSPELIAALAAPIGGQVEEYLKSDGREKILEYINKEVNALALKQPKQLLDEAFSETEILKDRVGNMVMDIYSQFIEKNADRLVAQFRVEEIISEKIAQMSNEALENLVLSVMKKELNAIVNLGALIGCVIGFLNNLI